ncbi:RICIN domain-containing protein [Paenibacillus yanchengensis]|uniref:RICIN domain-containing protein n=1 Tax=Paenibacillus yanchengensis TaxID=2035833 RepID=A0ABW4YLU9_9BACL
MKQLFMKKWVIAFMALILLGSAATAIFTETTKAKSAPRIITFENVNSRKVLGIGGDNKQSDGAYVIQWNFENTNDQKWYVEDAGDGFVYIRNLESGDLLDVSGASTADGAKVIQWPDNGGWNQQWKFVLADEDRGHSWYILNRGSGKYLEISDQSTADGAETAQWSLNRGPNQRWFFR